MFYAYEKVKNVVTEAYLHFLHSLDFVSEIGYTFLIEIYIPV